MDLVPVLPRRPLWADRQIIAAADLLAEQTWQDAQLSRLRRFALGWGVVAGFEVNLVDTDTLQIQSGYAISPMGHEAYLGQCLTWQGIHADLKAACLLDVRTNCDDPAATDKAPQTTGALPTHNAWLVVRPETLHSCPRPLVGDGCRNAGNDWALSRQSGALRFDIVCTLPAELLSDARSCNDLQEQHADGPMPMPPDLADMVPLALITFTSATVVGVSHALRRQLFPLGEQQALLACKSLPEPPKVTEPVWANPSAHNLDDLICHLADYFPNPTVDLNRTVASFFPNAVTNPEGGSTTSNPSLQTNSAILDSQAAIRNTVIGGSISAKIETSPLTGAILAPFDPTPLVGQSLAAITNPPASAFELTGHAHLATNIPMDSLVQAADVALQTEFAHEAQLVDPIRNVLDQAQHIPIPIYNPYQAFIAAALVTTEEHLTLWEQGEYRKIYDAPVTLLTPPSQNLTHWLTSITLHQLIKIRPNFDAFRLTYGCEMVTQLDHLLAISTPVRWYKPGAVAILKLLDQRIKLMPPR